jgi:hypothetical protein
MKENRIANENLTPIPQARFFRAYLQGAVPKAGLSANITQNMTLYSSSAAPPLGHGDDSKLRQHASCVLDVKGVPRHWELNWAVAGVLALQIASECGIEMSGFLADSNYVPISRPVIWGHYYDELPEEAIRFANAHTALLESLLLPERYSRVTNALRLYQGSLTLDNADLALLGFVGAIESLFSLAPQELAFRLSLLLAKFLGDERRTADSVQPSPLSVHRSF